jgi:hypothetical protein
MELLDKPLESHPSNGQSNGQTNGQSDMCRSVIPNLLLYNEYTLDNITIRDIDQQGIIKLFIVSEYEYEQACQLVVDNVFYDSIYTSTLKKNKIEQPLQNIWFTWVEMPDKEVFQKSPAISVFESSIPLKLKPVALKPPLEKNNNDASDENVFFCFPPALPPPPPQLNKPLQQNADFCFF